MLSIIRNRSIEPSWLDLLENDPIENGTKIDCNIPMEISLFNPLRLDGYYECSSENLYKAKLLSMESLILSFQDSNTTEYRMCPGEDCFKSHENVYVIWISI